MVNEVRSYFPIVQDFNKFDNEKIMETRAKLQTLQFKLYNLLEEGKNGSKVSNFEE